MRSESQAPALTRGIEILRLLEGERGLSLEDIASKLDAPRSSVHRLLKVMIDMDLIEKNESTKTYSALVSLLSLRDPATVFDSRRRRIMAQIATQTCRTAEWYVPVENGMMLQDRSQPEEQEVKIVAKTGFVRSWHTELEAVACLGLAWAQEAPEEHPQMWAYAEDGQRATLSNEESTAKITAARQSGFAFDRKYNLNGIRRFAVVIMNGDKLLGVMALAEHAAFSRTPPTTECMKMLADTAKELSDNIDFEYRIPEDGEDNA